MVQNSVLNNGNELKWLKVASFPIRHSRAAHRPFDRDSHQLTAVNLQLKSQNGNGWVKNSHKWVVWLFTQPFNVYYFFFCFWVSGRCKKRYWAWITRICTFKQYFRVPHRFLQDSKDSWGFLRIPQDSWGLHYNLSEFELEENNSVKSSGILRTGTEFGWISAKLSLLGRGHVT